MISIIGSEGSEQTPRRTYAPEEEVPESGIYQLLHADGAHDAAVFLRGATFPACEECGQKVRYSIVRAAPYIFDDENFK